MDPPGIRNSEMVERYLQGRLTADQERAFEEAYLGDPALLADVLLTEKLQYGLARLQHADQHADREIAAAARSAPRWRAVLGSAPYAAAATILLGLSVTLSAVLLVQNRNLAAGSSASIDAAPISFVPLVTVRGGAGANRVEVPPAGEWAVLLVDVGNDYEQYRATLTRTTGGAAERVVRLSELSATYDGRVGMGLPAGTLAPGEYEFLLEGRAAGGFEQITRIPVTVTPRP